MLNFDFLENDLGIGFPPHVVYDFSTETFLMLHSIKWTNAIAGLPLLLQILRNMCLAIIWFPGWDVLTFEMYFIFLIKSRGKNLNILRTKKAFKVKKAFFIIFKTSPKVFQTTECVFKDPVKHLWWSVSKKQLTANW